MVGLGRVELPTSRLSGVRSNQLSYRPENEGVKGASQSRERTPRRFSGKLKRVPLFNWIRPAPHQFLYPELPDSDRNPNLCTLRKEVIQPQVLLQLPCYDFTPITSHTLGACLLAVSPATSSTTSFHDVTGGVYKARERIHRGMLIHDY